MTSVLLLACGNPLRGDDGFGLCLAETAEQHFAPVQLRVVAAQQWTPEMAAEIALAEVVIFADASVTTPPGAVVLTPIDPVRASKERTVGAIRESHRLDPVRLLEFTEAWYGHRPRQAYLLTAGAASLEHKDGLSPDLLEAVIPAALTLLKQLIPYKN